MSAPTDPRSKEALEFLTTTLNLPPIELNDMQSSLKSGVTLCNFLNKLKPNTVTRINTSKMPFKEMENVDAYIKACTTIGVPSQYSFMTVDLYEAKNLNQVIQNLMSLKRQFGFGFEKCNPVDQQVKLELSEDQSTDKNASTQSHAPVVVDESLSKTLGMGMKAGVSELNSGVLSPECATCGLRVTSQVINACSKSWHVACFNCKRCGVKLSSSKYYEEQGKPYCEKCSFVVKPKTTNSVTAQTKDMGFSFE